MWRGYLIACGMLLISWIGTIAQPTNRPQIAVTDAGTGWAGNSVNTVVFRKNSLTSLGEMQFVSYYDQDGTVVLGKRRFGDSAWQLKRTQYKGNIRDAHNAISIMVDGMGFLHLAWDHHNTRLRYCRSLAPFSLEMGNEEPMIGGAEQKVTYPEFYRLPDGDLLFFYRDGASGNGNLVINKFSVSKGKWSRLQQNLIDGEGKRNAYWQACVDAKGAIHVSWVWRETPDVASNHDLCYAVSQDGGVTWRRSDGVQYQLPINLASAEVVCAIPQNSELINQTSMCTDGDGRPYIASYWKGTRSVPQYFVAYKKGNKWAVCDLGFRTVDFSLSGTGTKQIPISRPQLLSSVAGKHVKLWLVFRDEERSNRVSIATARNLRKNQWQLWDAIDLNTGAWEPSFDIERWKAAGELHMFVQPVTQADSEGVSTTAPQMVRIVSIKL